MKRMKRYRLQCKCCLSEFDWPDEDEKISNKDDLNKIAIICPGDESQLIASHCELIGPDGNVLSFKERFTIVEEY